MNQVKCNKCKVNEADIHIGHIHSNRKKNLYLCERCSYTLGISTLYIDEEYELNDSFEQFRLSESHSAKCPHCDTELSEFLSSGQTGCADCYDAFKVEIKKFFSTDSGEFFNATTLQHLAIELECAVIEGNFEQAATLRDKIMVLSSGKVNEHRGN